jgi:hypothetical protein
MPGLIPWREPLESGGGVVRRGQMSRREELFMTSFSQGPLTRSLTIIGAIAVVRYESMEFEVAHVPYEQR